jgi:hypothetical protein
MMRYEREIEKMVRDEKKIKRIKGKSQKKTQPKKKKKKIVG